jgi:hypothetical protein
MVNVMTVRDSLMVELTATKKTRLDLWLESLPDFDRNALLEAAADSRYTNAALMRVMKKHGYSPAKDTIGDWRERHGLTR